MLSSLPYVFQMLSKRLNRTPDETMEWPNWLADKLLAEAVLESLCIQERRLYRDEDRGSRDRDLLKQRQRIHLALKYYANPFKPHDKLAGYSPLKALLGAKFWDVGVEMLIKNRRKTGENIHRAIGNALTPVLGKDVGAQDKEAFFKALQQVKMPLDYLIEWSAPSTNNQNCLSHLTWKVPLSWKLVSEGFMPPDLFWESASSLGELTRNNDNPTLVNFGEYVFSKGDREWVKAWLSRATTQEIQRLLNQCIHWAPWLASQQACFQLLQDTLTSEQIQALNWSEMFAEWGNQEQKMGVILTEKSQVEQWYFEKTLPKTKVSTSKSRL